MPDIEPTVKIFRVEYVEIEYDGKKLVLPAKEAVDLIKPLSALLPDDLRSAS
jgi:hypothetical protein